MMSIRIAIAFLAGMQPLSAEMGNELIAPWTIVKHELEAVEIRDDRVKTTSGIMKCGSAELAFGHFFSNSSG